MAYVKQVWKNLPNKTTPVNAERMNHIEQGISDLYDAIFPIGQIVIKGDNEDYSNWLGFTWERTAVGKVLVGIDSSDTDFNIIGKNGGEKTHTLLKKELPKEVGQALIYDVNATEQSSLTDALTTQWSNKYRPSLDNIINQKGGQPHNIVQPYQVVAYWKRVA